MLVGTGPPRCITIKHTIPVLAGLKAVIEIKQPVNKLSKPCYAGQSRAVNNSAVSKDLRF